MKHKILFVMSLLFGLIFINAGLNKFLNYMPVPDNLPEEMTRVMNAFMEVGWLLPLIGIVEILGGLLFLIPKTRALAAIILLPVIVGIVLTHVVNAPEGLPVALILFVFSLWVMYEDRNKYQSLLKSS